MGRGVDEPALKARERENWPAVCHVVAQARETLPSPITTYYRWQKLVSG